MSVLAGARVVVVAGSESGTFTPVVVAGASAAGTVSPAALSGDDFVAFDTGSPADDQRLNNALFANGSGELFQGFGREITARLIGIWDDLFDRNRKIRPPRLLTPGRGSRLHHVGHQCR